MSKCGSWHAAIEHDISTIEAELESVPLPDGPDELFGELGRNFHHEAARTMLAIARRQTQEENQVEAWRALAEARDSLAHARNYRGEALVYKHQNQERLARQRQRGAIRNREKAEKREADLLKFVIDGIEIWRRDGWSDLRIVEFAVQRGLGTDRTVGDKLLGKNGMIARAEAEEKNTPL